MGDGDRAETTQCWEEMGEGKRKADTTHCSMLIGGIDIKTKPKPLIHHVVKGQVRKRGLRAFKKV